MRSQTIRTILLAILPVLTAAQTDISPPFNPDPSFTSNLPEVPEPTENFPSVTLVPGDPSVTLPTESDLTISITLIDPTPGPTIDPSDPILTGTPSPRPSLNPSTDGTGTGTLVTTTAISGSTTRSATASASSVTTSRQAAGAGRVGGGSVEAWAGGLFVGVLGGVAAFL